MIIFEEVSSLGRGNYIKVKKSGVGIGWIGRSLDGNYRYYEPPTNVLNPTFVEKSLEKLKAKIENYKSGKLIF